MQVEHIIGSTEDVTIRIPQFGWFLSDIAIDSEDRLYVCDGTLVKEYPGGAFLSGKIHVLHSNLTWLGSVTIPYDNTTGYPYCIAIDGKDRLIVGQSRAGEESRILVLCQIRPV